MSMVGKQRKVSDLNMHDVAIYCDMSRHLPETETPVPLACVPVSGAAVVVALALAFAAVEVSRFTKDQSRICHGYMTQHAPKMPKKLMSFGLFTAPSAVKPRSWQSRQRCWKRQWLLAALNTAPLELGVIHRAS